MAFISETRLVLNDDKSISFKEMQFMNIDAIFVTFEVLKLDKSKIVKLLHPSKIPSILTTFCVFNLLKFILVKDTQSLNI